MKGWVKLPNGRYARPQATGLRRRLPSTVFTHEDGLKGSSRPILRGPNGRFVSAKARPQPQPGQPTRGWLNWTAPRIASDAAVA